MAAQPRVHLPAETMMSTPPPTSELQQPPPQALHYALANAQQVQIHQIGEDGQVQVVCTSRQFAFASGRGGHGWEARGGAPRPALPALLDPADSLGWGPSRNS